jgi:hypothetical protein
MYPDEADKRWQSDDYVTARQNFIAACAEAGVEVASLRHPLSSPEGDELATDVARFGSENASRLLVMISGVHGVEGFSGSAAQVGWIAQRRYDSLPEDTAVLMVHLINPWGAAYLRRYNEDNVDLCRNFLDFSQPLPVNQKYAAIHDELVLGEVLGPSGERCGPYLGKKVAERGLEYVVDLFMAGQYQHEDGFGYGGQQAVWSNHTLRQILANHSEGVSKVCVLEFHTGLGPWAYGQLITMQGGSELERVREEFGPWVFNPSADKQPDEEGHRVVTGHTIEAYRTAFSDARLSAVTLEFGTFPPDLTLALLVREHLLVQQSSDLPPAVLEEIKAELLEYHHPKNWEWRCAFWSRSLQVIRQALSALDS